MKADLTHGYSIMRDRRLAFIGYGAMSQAVIAGLSKDPDPIVPGAFLVRSGASARLSTFKVFSSVDELISWRPDLVAECAGHAAIANAVPVILSAGIDMIVTSIGAFSLSEVQEKVEHAARAGGSKCHLVSGAIGGLDALAAAKHAGLHDVAYVGRKPPLAWLGTPAENKLDLTTIQDPAIIFEGTAEEACRLYPKNANVTAAVALAGIGFKQTMVRLIADPHILRNEHEVRAAGNFGEIEMRVSNQPLPDNPKTSWLAALSVAQAIRRQFSHSL